MADCAGIHRVGCWRSTSGSRSKDEEGIGRGSNEWASPEFQEDARREAVRVGSARGMGFRCVVSAAPNLPRSFNYQLCNLIAGSGSPTPPPPYPGCRPPPPRPGCRPPAAAPPGCSRPLPHTAWPLITVVNLPSWGVDSVKLDSLLITVGRSASRRIMPVQPHQIHHRHRLWQQLPRAGMR